MRKARDKQMEGEALQQARLVDPGGYEVNLALGSYYARQGDVEAGIQCLRTASRSAPRDSRIARLLGDAESSRGNTGAALRWYHKGVKRAPNDPGLWNNLGTACFEGDRLAEAARCFEEALKKRFPSHLLRYNRGLLSWARGRFGEAWEDLEWRWDLESLCRVTIDSGTSTVPKVGWLFAARANAPGGRGTRPGRRDPGFQYV